LEGEADAERLAKEDMMNVGDYSKIEIIDPIT
jgi:hypothetical protein